MVGRIVATALSVLVLIVTGFVSILAGTTGQLVDGLITPCPAELNCAGTTILLVGSDARVDAAGNPLSAEELAAVATEADGGGTSTDTMMLVHIPSNGGKATAVSIPRDSWISNPPAGPSDSTDSMVPYSPNKVNSFYGSAKFYTAEKLVAAGVTDRAQVEVDSSNAGRRMLISVLEGLTKTHIDHYAEINLFGFYLLSNAIGGVPVCLLKPVNDPMSGADFAAGPQEVQGTAALSFVRQRHGLPNGDLDRIRRQQAFLSGALAKVLSVGTLTNPTTLSSLIAAANRTITMSSNMNLLELAQQLAAISSGNITFATMPTQGAEASTTKDALHIDESEIQKLFSDIVNEVPADQNSSSVAQGSITVDVQNGTMTSGLAKATSDIAVAAGFTRGQYTQFPGTSADNQQSITTIHYRDGEEAAATKVRDSLGFGTLQVDAGIDTGHVLVVTGVDHTEAVGWRGAPAAVSVTTAQAAARAVAPGDTINAAAPGCVN